MEEHDSPQGVNEETGARSAEALRALEERAHSALARQQERIDHLEQRLSEQLDAVCDQLAEGLADAEAGQEAAAEVEQLRAQLAESQQAWEAERQELEERLRGREEELERRRQELDDGQRELDERRAQIESNNQVTATRTVQIDGREIELNLREHQLGEKEAASDGHEKELNKLKEQLEKRDKDLAGREEKIKSAEEYLQEREQAIEKRQHELGKANEASSGQVAELKKQLADAEEQSKKHQEEIKKSFSHLEKGFVEKEKTLQEDLAALGAERDKLVEAVNATSRRLDESQAAAKERDELQQKFDLALADVQRMRERTSELEQELARRPEAVAGESVEMVHLKTERDALAERVAELEKQLAEPTDSSADEEISNLRRRFELAVEDVRQLKTENAELQQKLASASAVGPASAAGDGQDWESQKRRLLASLEDEGDHVDAARREERATIENTIRITDEVVAEKDREISQLEARLSVAESAAPPEEPSAEDEALTDLLSSDEVIQQHRQRSAELEKELVDKLRAAELEMSVQRAKIAREQTELAEWRMELETLRASLGSSESGEGGGGPPKRRWLTKLGLGDDES